MVQSCAFDAGCEERIFNEVVHMRNLARFAILAVAIFVGAQWPFDARCGSNYEGLWWNAPAGSESGWGLNLAHQGNVIFATWFTYDAARKPWWLSMTLTSSSSNVFTGSMVETHGPAFSAAPFDAALVTRKVVGTAAIDFNATTGPAFTYMVNGIAQTKTLARQEFALPIPVCTFPATKDLALADNFQDLWWNEPAASESGWGINLTHQGDVIFATWFTYGDDGTPLWLSLTAVKQSSGTYTGVYAGVYSGEIVTSTGPVFNATPFDPGAVTRTVVGTGTLVFVNGNRGAFAYAVNGISQTKPIIRQVLVSPGTLCQ